MGVQKVSMNFPEEVLGDLRDAAARDNISMTEATRRAITTWRFLQDAQRAGKQLLLRDPETKETERIVFQ